MPLRSLEKRNQNQIFFKGKRRTPNENAEYAFFFRGGEGCGYVFEGWYGKGIVGEKKNGSDEKNSGSFEVVSKIENALALGP